MERGRQTCHTLQHNTTNEIKDLLDLKKKTDPILKSNFQAW